MSQATSRTAGFLYLIVVVTGFYSLAYVPARLIVRTDAAETVGRIIASESLFRSGIVAGIVCYTAFMLLPLVLYKLLSPVNQSAAVLMVAFALVSVPISFVNTLPQLEILSLVGSATYLQTLTAEQLQVQVMLLLASYGNGLLVLKVFWGLWLLPFGYLVFRSGFLPRTLGVLLMLGCLGYLVDFLGRALALDYMDTAMARYLRRPAAIGEIGTCLWLLIMGVRGSAVRTTAT